MVPPPALHMSQCCIACCNRTRRRVARPYLSVCLRMDGWMDGRSPNQRTTNRCDDPRPVPASLSPWGQLRAGAHNHPDPEPELVLIVLLSLSPFSITAREHVAVAYTADVTAIPSSSSHLPLRSTSLIPSSSSRDGHVPPEGQVETQTPASGGDIASMSGSSTRAHTPISVHLSPCASKQPPPPVLCSVTVTRPGRGAPYHLVAFPPRMIPIQPKHIAARVSGFVCDNQRASLLSQLA